ATVRGEPAAQDEVGEGLTAGAQEVRARVLAVAQEGRGEAAADERLVGRRRLVGLVELREHRGLGAERREGARRQAQRAAARGGGEHEQGRRLARRRDPSELARELV